MRNIERISEDQRVDYFQIQHFITESNWDTRKVIDQAARTVSSVLTKTKKTALIINESGWVKKGDKRVGVRPQYCGNVGKIANSQVTVFASLSNDDFASMVNARLYLPKDWCNNPSRCDESGIPEENRVFTTKLELAEDAPLLSARDIKELIVFELYKKMSKDNIIERIFNRHLVRQRDINKSFTKKSNLSTFFF